MKSVLKLDWPRVITINSFLFFLHSQGSKEKSSFLKAIRFFLTELATHELAAAESCFSLGEKTSHFSPREVDQYNFSKCTIIVRLLEFATMILDKGDQEFWKVSLNLRYSQIKKVTILPLKDFCSLYSLIHSFWNKTFLCQPFLSLQHWWCVSHPL